MTFITYYLHTIYIRLFTYDLHAIQYSVSVLKIRGTECCTQRPVHLGTDSCDTAREKIKGKYQLDLVDLMRRPVSFQSSFSFCHKSFY